jgi:hypothetical protein
MRNLSIAFSLASLACASEGAKVESGARDSTIVAGAPAVPVSQPPAGTGTGQPPITKTTPPATNVPATKAPSSTATPSRPDSIRGVVSVVGTSFDKRVMIAERGTQRRVEVVGTQASLIGHVAGAEVSASGALSGTQLNANRFVVRSVDGQPAIDGMLRTEGSSLFIVTADGVRTRITAPPPPLVGHDGARVWITGDPTKAVSSFGFIDPPR